MLESQHREEVPGSHTKSHRDRKNKEKPPGKSADKNSGNFFGTKSQMDKVSCRLSGLDHKQAETTRKCGHR